MSVRRPEMGLNQKPRIDPVSPAGSWVCEFGCCVFAAPGKDPPCVAARSAGRGKTAWKPETQAEGKPTFLTLESHFLGSRSGVLKVRFRFT